MKRKKKIDPDLQEIMPLLIGVWRRFRKEAGPPDVLQTREFRSVVESIIWMRKLFDTQQQGPVEDYFKDRIHVSSYLLYFWVLHYLEGLSLIQELPSPPRRVLDLCAGPAPFAFSALKSGATEVIALDRSQLALELGADVCGRYGYPLTVRSWNYPQRLPKVDGKFDLIILGYAMEELFPSGQKGSDAAFQNYVKELTSLLTPEGHLLVVENSKFEFNRRILKLREQLVQQGIPVQAPCVWRGPCPALATPDSPCYAQREFAKPFLVKEIQRAAQINLSSLKMSYVIFRNPESGWPQLPERPMYRVVSPPVDTFHGKRYYLCGTDGGKRLESHLKEHPKESRAFEFLRRGDLISFENAMIKPNGIEIVQDTKVIIEAACGKPIPSLESDESMDV